MCGTTTATTAILSEYRSPETFSGAVPWDGLHPVNAEAAHSRSCWLCAAIPRGMRGGSP